MKDWISSETGRENMEGKEGESMYPTINHLYALSELFRLPVDELIVGSRKYMPSGENPMIRYDGRIHDVLFLTRMWAYYQCLVKTNIA